MAGYYHAATDRVKRIFSATESYLYQLKGAGTAVLSVLKPRIRQKEYSLEPQWKEGNEVNHTVFNTENENLNSNENLYKQQNEGYQEKWSILSCILGSLCYPFFPCAQFILPSKCVSNVANSNKFCTSCGCNCCICTGVSSNVDGSGNCICNLVRSQWFFNTVLCMCPFLLVFYLFWTYYDDYLSKLLTSFEEMDQELACVIFVLLFIIASLPLVWGYVILNLAAGYRFGIIAGVFVVMASVTIGLSLTHRISQRFCANCIMKLIKRQSNADHLEGILKVLDGPAGLKVIALTRLTPIPFGLQNGIFSMSNIKTRHYVAASNIGLFPTQVLNCYIGSTFRSAEDVLSRGGSIGGYVVFLIQLSIGFALMTFVVRHARKELASALKDSTKKPEPNCENLGNTSDGEILTDVRVTQPGHGSPSHNSS
uniref:transmembrane protein 64-like n=1 Tax=Styela clava TaxID=7725 RepID=UPI001939BC35|nr:transmembrane protein 64-like [Styela clava]